jgi:hypothetical protein
MTGQIRSAHESDLQAIKNLLESSSLPAEGIDEHLGSFFVAEQLTSMGWPEQQPFGPDSGAALATVVGVLVEVPVMLSVCSVCNRTRHWFPAESSADK